MDQIDQELLILLRHNARQSISDLATTLNVSRATVRSRLKRLEESNEIVGYTVVLQSDALELPVRGMTSIEIEGLASSRVIRALSGFFEISEIHTTNGRWDLVIELGAKNLADFDETLRKIRLIPGVRNTETSLLLTAMRSVKAKL